MIGLNFYAPKQNLEHKVIDLSFDLSIRVSEQNDERMIDLHGTNTVNFPSSEYIKLLKVYLLLIRIENKNGECVKRPITRQTLKYKKFFFSMNELFCELLLTLKAYNL